MQYRISHIGKNCLFDPGTTIGYEYKPDCGKVSMGDDCLIRSGSIIYGDVSIGNNFQTGHNVVIREHTLIGSHIVIGTNTVVEGHVRMGDFVKIESNSFLPTHTTIGSRVFIGPGTVLTNDRYPQKMRNQYQPEGPVIQDGVSLGAGVVVLPGVTIGKGSFVAAGTVVIRDIPAMSMVKGVPGRVSPLPDKLREMNTALNWRHLL
jgi:acetyltransferase-like isoleucine patch superfamily enzyme